MAKKIVEDVVPPRRSIRNIPLPDDKLPKQSPKLRARRSSVSSPVLAKEEVEIDTTNGATADGIRNTNSSPLPVNDNVREENNIREEYVLEKSRGGNGWRRIIIWSVATISVLILVYASSLTFSKATIKITPKQWTGEVEISLEASQNSDTLSYNLVTINGEMSRDIPATGEEQIEQKASGEIIIFNDHSPASQTLIKNTRFQTPEGLIFRIKDAVSVPGTTTQGGVTTPGKLKVEVFAEEAGEKYNIGLSDFIIPGFAGDPRQKTIAAKSDPTKPIFGGFVGNTKTAIQADIDIATSATEEGLRTKLSSRAVSETPKDQVFFPSSSIITFENITDDSGGSTLTIKKNGTLTGALFDKKELSLLLGDFLPEEARGIPNEIINWKDISLVFEDDSESKLTSGETIKFKLQGKIIAVANIDSDNVRSNIAGKKRSNFSQIMSETRSVAKAELQTYPSWSRSLPRSVERINVEIEPNN